MTQSKISYVDLFPRPIQNSNNSCVSIRNNRKCNSLAVMEVLIPGEFGTYQVSLCKDCFNQICEPYQEIL